MTLRIGAGDQKGRVLRAPVHAPTRPSSARLRAALFNILGARLLNAVWLDLYAGSGIVGLEALCRGASWATFVESDPEAGRCIDANIRTLALQTRTLLWRGTVQEYLRRPGGLPPTGALYNLVFADPPYATVPHVPSSEQLLLLFGQSGKIAPHAWIMIEHGVKTAMPAGHADWRRHRTYAYGDSALTVYHPTAPNP
ncbi:MAG TPA: 16S rRNA (guanine(966)-N(2))-methyltransferase RsmD [Nitrospiria bacterium]|nr:16S rRNA (guanine(966)-N(2))-methyltransferase RsmD [Nitrospiria bacterium]